MDSNIRRWIEALNGPGHMEKGSDPERAQELRDQAEELRAQAEELEAEADSLDDHWVSYEPLVFLPKIMMGDSTTQVWGHASLDQDHTRTNSDQSTDDEGW